MNKTQEYIQHDLDNKALRQHWGKDWPRIKKALEETAKETAGDKKLNC